jgi:uncharacterized membrane protein
MEVALVWIVAIICSAIVAAIGVSGTRNRDNLRPEDLLARRYAAGEIDEGEYLMRLSILRDANELTT